MDLARWQEIKSLVQEALELPPHDQPTYLAAISDAGLRREVGALLAVSTSQVDVFEHFRAVPAIPQDVPFSEGDEIGSFTILRMLDRGGMATVYLARDTKHERTVALKILARSSSRIPAEEHRILARLSHPNIAALYDSGTTDSDLRYVAMEYIEGVPISTFCETQHLPIASRLELFQKVCAAVADAHRHLVVHRDLKPSNILVTAAGEPKLLDFGIAKILHPEATALLTSLEERPFTVAFASPEQLGGELTTTATDIYSLGVLLCVLLTGRLPYKVRQHHDLPWAIRNLEPHTPSDLVGLASDEAVLAVAGTPPGDPASLRRQVQGDLDAIVLRALRREPDRRYRSVDELAEDIRRYLDHEPVLARRGTRRYRTAKFVRRHRRGVLAGVFVLLLLAAAAIALLLAEREAVRERDRAETVSTFLVDMFKVPNPWSGYGKSIPVTEVLDGALRKVNEAPPPAQGTRGTVYLSLGRIYLNLGLFTPAETLLVPALADLEATHADKTIIVQTLTDLAILEYHQGRYQEAEGYARRSLAENPHPEETETRSLLGHLAFSRGDFRKAELLFTEVLNRETRLHGEVHPLVAGALNDLACALHEQGRLASAEPLYQRSLRIRRHVFGERHIDVLQSLYNLGSLYEDQGRSNSSASLLHRIEDLEYSLAVYDPARASLMQNLGSRLVTKRDFARAGLELDGGLAMQRRLLFDGHPDIARSLAEIGRLAHALHRYRDAETSYRESLKRFDQLLGPNHPDRLSAANNLAVLLAEEGRVGEAEALWHDLVPRATRQAIRPAIPRTLVENAATLHRGSHRSGPEQTVNPRAAPYRLLSISSLDLTDPSRSAYLPETLPGQLVGERANRTLFSDDFTSGTIDGEKWEYGGNVVLERDGALQILRTVQDSGGWARTRSIEIDPRRPLIIERRAKVYAANNYFDGTMSVNIIGYPEQRFAVSYANYHYHEGGECETVGFSLIRHDANPHRFFDRTTNASDLLPPIWGRWFDEELVYNPVTGEVRYAIDGKLRLTYNVGPLPPRATSITLGFETWGWYTGHYQWMDRLVVRQ